MNDRKNFIWNFLGLSINSFNSLFFLIIINRINGGADAGVFTFSFSLIGLLFYIGLFYTRTFQISRSDISNKEYIRSREINCVAMMLVTIALCILFRYDSYKFTIIILIGLYRMLEAYADVFYGILQAKDELYKSGRSLFFKGIIGILLFLIFDLMFKDVRISCLVLVIVNLLGLIFYDIRNAKKYITNSFKKENLKLIYKLAFPIFVFSFLNLYLANATKYTLDFYDSAEIQNIFGIILMPATVLSLCCQYILNPFMLRFSQFKDKKDYKSFKSLARKILLSVIGIGLLAEVVCFFIGIPVLNIIYGLNLSDYKLMLLIIIIGSIFYAIVSIFSVLLTMLGKNTIQMVIYIICSILTLGLSIVLISNYKIMGASICYSVVMFILCMMFYMSYKYIIKKVEGE
ncbi:MAG: hypothetical protein E7159_03930 [Firmicutes bacterium]|nr:hypothetical protein [Bacillota bacterium]